MKTLLCCNVVGMAEQISQTPGRQNVTDLGAMTRVPTIA